MRLVVQYASNNTSLQNNTLKLTFFVYVTLMFNGNGMVMVLYIFHNSCLTIEAKRQFML